MHAWNLLNFCCVRLELHDRARSLRSFRAFKFQQFCVYEQHDIKIYVFVVVEPCSKTCVSFLSEWHQHYSKFEVEEQTRGSVFNPFVTLSPTGCRQLPLSKFSRSWKTAGNFPGLQTAVEEVKKFDNPTAAVKLSSQPTVDSWLAWLLSYWLSLTSVAIELLAKSGYSLKVAASDK